MEKIKRALGNFFKLVFPSENNRTTWLVIVLIKLAFWLVFINLGSNSGHKIEHGVIISNDYHELLFPADQFAEFGVYTLDESPGGAPYTGRLPGYSAPYLIFRMIFDRSIALPLFILFQVMLISLALTRFGGLIKKRHGEWPRYVFLLLSIFLSWTLPWEIMTYPEILALACFMLGIVSFDDFLNSRKHRQVLLAGFWFGWMFFLRGFLAPYLLLLALPLLVLAWRESKRSLRWIKLGFLFSLPFLVMETAWVSRNYAATGDFIPLQTSFISSAQHDASYDLNTAYKPSMLALRGLVACWGGDNVHFYPDADMAWFINPDADTNSPPFPSYAYTERLGNEEFLRLRSLVQNSFDKTLPVEARLKADMQLGQLATRYTNEFREDKPMIALLIAPVLRLKNLMIRNVVGNWPGPGFSQSGIVFKLWKAGVLATYFLSILIGFIVIIVRAFTRRLSLTEWMLVACLISLVVMFTLVFNTAEFKYFMTGYVILLYFTSVGLGQLLSLRVFKSTLT